MTSYPITRLFIHNKIFHTLILFLLCMFLFASQAHANLFQYIADGDLAKIQQAVEQGADVNAKTGQGFSPLLYASQTGHLDIIKYLVGKRADIHAKDTMHRTPLIWAATFSHLDVVQYLVTQGADMHAKDTHGRTAIDHAHINKRQSVVNYLKSIK